jgi:hypothetical protein
MGQQETVTVATEEKGGGTLRRMILALLVAALIAVMAMSTVAGPAAAAGNHFAKGKGPSSVSTNPGNFVNNDHGDDQNDHCISHGNCRAGDNNGGGVGNN